MGLEAEHLLSSPVDKGPPGRLSHSPSFFKHQPVRRHRPGWGRWARYYLWFYLVTPLWWIYYGVAYSYQQIFIHTSNFFHCVYYGFAAWGFFFHGLLKLIFQEPVLHLYRLLRQSRWVRLAIWVYTSWIFVDLLDNNHREQDTESFEDFEPLDIRVEQEIDYDDELSELEDDSGDGIDYNLNDRFMGLAHPFYFGNPIWEWYLHHIPDGEMEELMEEVSYFTRFITRPVVDLVVRLPFWSFLELFSLSVETAKREYHRLWLLTLTRGNTPRPG